MVSQRGYFDSSRLSYMLLSGTIIVLLFFTIIFFNSGQGTLGFTSLLLLFLYLSASFIYHKKLKTFHNQFGRIVANLTSDLHSNYSQTNSQIVPSSSGLILLQLENFEKINRKRIEALKSFNNQNGKIDIAEDYNDSILYMINEIINSVNILNKETTILTGTVKSGELSTRIDISELKTPFSTIAQQINELVVFIDTLCEKTNEMFVDIAGGNISLNGYKPTNILKVNESYSQTCSQIHNFINTLSENAIKISEGNLTDQVDTENLSGIYHDAFVDFNTMLESIVTPLQNTVNTLVEISGGNLTAELPGEYKGDHGLMKEALKMTMTSLSEILNKVLIGIDQFSEGSKQVSDASQSLSQGATEQASSIEEITSAMTELQSQTELNTKNARKANELSDQISKNAESGITQMENLLGAIGEINDSSSQIAKIIRVIDEIAFQTNLLALNAAVEAARAGVHGKGFAVVAEEVRTLALRSAKAAKETSQLIEGSIRRVEKGTSLADTTAQEFVAMVEGINSVSEMIANIDKASEMQSFQISEINSALTQIEQVTQGSTANAEESAAAAQELSSQAFELHQLISRLTLHSSESTEEVLLLPEISE